MRTLLLVPLAILGWNPSGDNGGQFGEETGPRCVVDSTTTVEMDEVTDLGFAAQAVVDAAQGDFTSPIAWADGTESEFSISLTEGTNPRVIHYIIEDDGSGMEIDIGCTDTVAVDFTMSLSTADGVLSDSGTWTLELLFAEDTLSHAFDLDDVGGTFDSDDYANADFDRTWANATLLFDSEGVDGVIEGGGEQSHGSGPDGTVSATWFAIATIGEGIDGGM
jgi:hypothetical protein